MTHNSYGHKIIIQRNIFSKFIKTETIEQLIENDRVCIPALRFSRNRTKSNMRKYQIFLYSLQQTIFSGLNILKYNFKRKELYWFICTFPNWFAAEYGRHECEFYQFTWGTIKYIFIFPIDPDKFLIFDPTTGL